MTNESMKKVFQTKLTDTRATDVEGIGVIRFEGSRIFKWCKYNKGGDSVAAVANKTVVYHGDDAVVLDSACEVTMDYSSGDDICAGMLMAIIADGEFGWVQIKGIAILAAALTAGADGDQVTTLGAADGTLDVVVTGAITPYAGYAMDVSAKEVMLDCPW